ncbi:Protein saf1 [Madurella mycetomatis]|uniref:Protein saf1 n=1 Tax=Madurella mycetomatis TaxID=100816 RepID=A0A175VQL9_9PEZI|nr:Protein saf1 [Madurella mycetomatis]
MAKERNYNPVQAQRKAEKAKAIKKGKAEQQARRNEKLAKRNPDRIQKQIDDLKALKEGGGKLTAHEEQALEALEKDLKAVKKAREALGDSAPKFGHGPPRQGQRSDGVLGKRRRDAEDTSSSESDVPDDVRNIPMPRDTPPPIPKEILDEWYAKRRAKRNANQEPVAERRPESEKPAAPLVEAKTVYEAKPVVRDLRKEAGRLLEPEEADQLEKEGYLRTSGTVRSQPEQMQIDSDVGARKVTVEEVEDEDD